jgi:hypothetical protein
MFLAIFCNPSAQCMRVRIALYRVFSRGSYCTTSMSQAQSTAWTRREEYAR